MARRLTKAEMFFLTWAVIIGLPIWAAAKLGEVVGWAGIAAMLVGALLLYFFYRKSRRVARRFRLTAKYGDKELVGKLMSRSFWTGQTAEQLIDSLGAPSDVDKKVLRTKKKEVWKYNQEKARTATAFESLWTTTLSWKWDQKN